jgi:CRP-like cAMP-binding protein
MNSLLQKPFRNEITGYRQRLQRFRHCAGDSLFRYRYPQTFTAADRPALPSAAWGMAYAMSTNVLAIALATTDKLVDNRIGRGDEGGRRFVELSDTLQRNSEPVAGLTASMSRNLILGALPADELGRLQPHLVATELKQRQTLYRTDGAIDYVYFVESGLVSLVNADENGDGIEVGIVGAEGVVGAAAALGARKSSVQVIVQIAGHALRISAANFVVAYAQSTKLRELVNKYIEILLFQGQQNAVCYARHSVEGRLCRWLLEAYDAAQSERLDLTQEFLSNMLAVQRTSVSIFA